MLRPLITGTIVLSLLTSAGCSSLVRETWADGSPKRSGSTSWGDQSGRWRYFHTGGTPAAEGDWLNDLQEGSWIYRHPDGSFSAIGNYHAGLKQGLWDFRHPAGKGQAARGVYRDDRQHGLWLAWDTQGRLRATGWYDRGVWSGPWASYRDDGRTSEAGAIIAGVRVGPWIRRAADGAITTQDHGGPAGWTISLANAGEGLRRWELRRPNGTLAARTASDATGELRLIEVPGNDQLAVLAWTNDGRAQLAGDHPDATAIADLRTKLAADPVPPPAKPVSAPKGPAVKPPTSMSLLAVETTPALPSVPSDPVLPPSAAALSPAPTLPGLWTAHQEGKAADLVAAYAGKGPALSSPAASGYYDPQPEAPKSHAVWHGKALPQTRFLASDGGVLDLAAWRGRKVVLVMMRGFSGQVCLYCAAQTAALSDNIGRIRAAGAEVAVVYPGPVEAVPSFIQAVQSLRKEPPPLPICLDAGLQLVRALVLDGNLAQPATLVLDGEGVVRWSYVGTSIADRPSVGQVLEALAK